MDNCTITGADTRMEEPTALGGCIFNHIGTAAFTNCTITGGNAGQDGGDVDSLSGAILDLTNCLVTGGTAGGVGGGLYSSGNAMLTDCTISGNTAGTGGGIANGSLNPSANLSVIDCTISGNSAVSGGGGVDNNGILTLTDCTLANNSGGSGFLYSGGGGVNNSGVATLVACTVSGNNAANNGGGIYDGGPVPDLVTLTIYDTIVAGNTTTTSERHLAKRYRYQSILNRKGIHLRLF